MKRLKFKLWKLTCKAANRIEKLIFSETYEELENQNIDLQNKIDDLQDEIEYLKETRGRRAVI